MTALPKNEELCEAEKWDRIQNHLKQLSLDHIRYMEEEEKLWAKTKAEIMGS